VCATSETVQVRILMHFYVNVVRYTAIRLFQPTVCFNEITY